MKHSVPAIVKQWVHVVSKVVVALMFFFKKRARHLAEPIKVVNFVTLILVSHLAA
jgi:hypothetical protein